MGYKFIDAQEIGAVLVLTMDDPPTRNSIGEEMAGELNQEIDRLEGSSQLRALVLTGRDPSFCSGANVKRMDDANQSRESEPPLPEGVLPWEVLEQRWAEMPEVADEGTEEIDDVRFIPLRLHELQKPSIAAVNGYAMGLGMGIALSCDIRIASEKVGMSEMFVRRGLIPADGSCWQLPRMIGLSNTYLQAYTGDRVDAETALRWGLVSKVVPHDQLMDATLELATRLANGPVYSMGLIKYLIQQSLNLTFE
ncbi:MAG: enoyl-CoA hydratase-related protein, partial [SAR202 cluster bacterium]|nr:enoyl-CoA hydratase-related protein [SAR202 cluster bacterium]